MKALVEDLNILVFRLSETTFGVPMEQVQSIERISLLTKKPKIPTFYRGTLYYRDKTIPVFDMVQLLLHTNFIEGETARIITVNSGNLSFGFLVDGVYDELHVSSSCVEQINCTSKDPIPFLNGVTYLSNTLVILTDLIKLINAIYSCSQFDIKSINNCINGPNKGWRLCI